MRRNCETRSTTNIDALVISCRGHEIAVYTLTYVWQKEIDFTCSRCCEKSDGARGALSFYFLSESI